MINILILKYKLNKKGIGKMKKLIKVLVGTLITGVLVFNYIFPTTVTTNEYGTYIELFDGTGYMFEK